MPDIEAHVDVVSKPIKGMETSVEARLSEIGKAQTDPEVVGAKEVESVAGESQEVGDKQDAA